MNLAHHHSQNFFQALVKGFIELHEFPKNFVIYMYYGELTSGKVEAFSFSSDGISMDIKDEVSRICLMRFRRACHVCYENMKISTYAGFVEDNRFNALLAIDLDAISLIIGCAVLNLTKPIDIGVARKDSVVTYAITLSVVSISEDIQKIRQKVFV